MKESAKRGRSRRSSQPLRFAHPFYTSQPVAARKPVPGVGTRLVDHIKGNLEPIPAPTRTPRRATTTRNTRFACPPMYPACSIARCWSSKTGPAPQHSIRAASTASAASSSPNGGCASARAKSSGSGLRDNREPGVPWTRRIGLAAGSPHAAHATTRPPGRSMVP